MNCPNCDTALGANAKFCASCGLPLADNVTVVATSSGAYFSSDYSVTSHERRPVLIAGVCAVAALIFGVIWMSVAARNQRAAQTERQQFAQFTAPANSYGQGQFTAPATMQSSYVAPIQTYRPRPIVRQRRTMMAAVPVIDWYPPRMNLTDGLGRADFLPNLKTVPTVLAFAGEPTPARLPTYDPNLESPNARDWMNPRPPQPTTVSTDAPPVAVATGSGYYNSGGFYNYPGMGYGAGLYPQRPIIGRSPAFGAGSYIGGLQPFGGYGGYGYNRF